MIKSRGFFLFLAPFFVLCILVFYIYDYTGLLNFVSGYLSTLIIFAATSFGYWQMVHGNSKLGSYKSEYDHIDRIDDRFELWDEMSYDAKECVKEVLKEEKKRLKKSKRGFKEFLKNAKPAISVYRILAYAVLAFTVYKLIETQRFEPFIFLFGVGVAPLVITLFLYKSGFKVKR